jgi:MFS transporter, ACS family, tartrate transporter
MVTWGIISGLMALVSGEWSFYVLRVLLGVAEAGFFPGIVLYLIYWYPAEYRARFLAAFAIAVPVSTVIGAPVSGLLLGLDGLMGLKRLAMAVRRRGRAIGAARPRHLVLSHRQA